jgi:hypothetical protein
MLSIKDIKILFFKFRIWISHFQYPKKYYPSDIQYGFHSLDNNVQQFHYKTYIQRDKIFNYKLHVHKLISL